MTLISCSSRSTLTELRAESRTGCEGKKSIARGRRRWTVDGGRPFMFEYSPEAIQSNLQTLTVGRTIEMHRSVDSTNDLAKGAGRRGEPEGLVVLAEEQVKGRGRLGRTWSAPPGSSVLC